MSDETSPRKGGAVAKSSGARGAPACPQASGQYVRTRGTTSPRADRRAARRAEAEARRSARAARRQHRGEARRRAAHQPRRGRRDGRGQHRGRRGDDLQAARARRAAARPDRSGLAQDARRHLRPLRGHRRAHRLRQAAAPAVGALQRRVSGVGRAPRSTPAGSDAPRESAHADGQRRWSKLSSGATALVFFCAVHARMGARQSTPVSFGA
jgi:hypothetical protein